jgi:GT2 family glycosyltransferase
MRLSYVIISHNNKETLLQTLASLPTVTPLPPSLWETWVVDNASTDGSPDAVAERFPRVNLIRNPKEQETIARNLAFAQCNGQYVISMDEDSHPMDHRSVATALSRMDRDPSLAAIVGRVELSNGEAEAPALPGVTMSGATCFRKSVLDQVGGFQPEFYRQAEDYDLSFRIWAGGYRIHRSEQIVFRHQHAGDKARDSSQVHRLDLRNNLIIARRFLPRHLAKIYGADWKLRYQAIARHSGAGKEAYKGLWGARASGFREMFKKQTHLSDQALEHIFGFRAQATAVGNWARQHAVWRVIIADFGKNIYATWNACRSCGLQIRCIADDHPAFENLEYRGLPLISSAGAFEGGGIDGVVVSNINPAEIESCIHSIRRHFHGPILRLWKPPQAIRVPHASAA